VKFPNGARGLSASPKKGIGVVVGNRNVVGRSYKNQHMVVNIVHHWLKQERVSENVLRRRQLVRILENLLCTLNQGKCIEAKRQNHKIYFKKKDVLAADRFFV
jgi:ribosomal protein L17